MFFALKLRRSNKRRHEACACYGGVVSFVCGATSGQFLTWLEKNSFHVLMHHTMRAWQSVVTSECWFQHPRGRGVIVVFYLFPVPDNVLFLSNTEEL